MEPDRESDSYDIRLDSCSWFFLRSKPDLLHTALSHKPHADQEHQSRSASLRPLFGPRPAMLLEHLHRPQVRRGMKTKPLQSIELALRSDSGSLEGAGVAMKQVCPDLMQTSLFLAEVCTGHSTCFPVSYTTANWTRCQR